MFACIVATLQRAAYAIGSVFPCKPVTPTLKSPTDVTNLHPGHVSVVMAMGDSITAGFAARSMFHQNRWPFEYRADSFSIGAGSSEYWTLPYILQQFNSSVSGFSTGVTLPQIPSIGYLDKQKDFMNAALTNSVSKYLLRQLEELQTQSRRIHDFNDRWKVLTIFIGANDLCMGFDACNGTLSARTLADTFERNVAAALASVHDSFSRVFVNLVSLFSLASVRRVTANHHGLLPCHFEARLLNECDCMDRPTHGSSQVSREQLDMLNNTTALLNARLIKLATAFNHRRPDFAVVAQTPLALQDIPDFSYISELDCFHPSAKGHHLMALKLWNAMLNPDKATQPLNTSTPLTCPNPNSFFYSGKLERKSMQSKEVII